MKKKTKIYLTLSGAIAASIPIATVLSCGSQNNQNNSGPQNNYVNWSGVNNSTITNNDVKDLQKKILSSLGNDEQTQLTNGLATIKKDSPVAAQKLDDGNYTYSEPSFATFSGNPGQAKLDTNFSVSDSSIAKDLTIKYYVALDQKANEITDLRNINVKNGDQFFVLVTPTSSTALINGQTHVVMKFQVSGLKDGSKPVDDPNYYVNDPKDPGIYDRLGQQTANYDDIFNLMDQMKAGQVIAKGNYKLQLPQDISTRVHAASTPIPGHVAAPFVDISMAAMTDQPLDQKTMEAFKTYKYLSFGFIAGGKNSDGIQYGSWAGNPTLTEDSQTNIINIVNQIRDAGGDFIPSIGGANESTAIWQGGADPIILARWIELFAINYHLQRIDYDIEGGHASDPALPIYAAATAIAQKKLAQEGHPLELTLTLAAEWNGLDNNGTTVLDTFIKSGASFTMLNGMTMMMNADKTKELGGLGGVTNNSVDSMKDQVKQSYANVGVTLTDAQAYAKIGTTIDISSDTWISEYATEKDFQTILDHAKTNKIGQVGYWSIAGENFAINGMKMTLAELVKIAASLGLPTEGKTIDVLMQDVVNKLGGKLPVYGIYSQFDTGDKSPASKTEIPNADQIALANANKYASQSSQAGPSAFDRVNFNLPDFDQAMASGHGGISQGTEIISPGLGEQSHIFKAKYWATHKPWPAQAQSEWQDMGIAINNDEHALTHPALVAETLSITYQTATPWYIRLKNSDGSLNPKPTTPSEHPELDEINSILLDANVSNVVEYDKTDNSRNHFVGKDNVFFEGIVYTVKWDTAQTSPTDPYTPGTDPWDHTHSIKLF